jgi:hypothetical protein
MKGFNDKLEFNLNIALNEDMQYTYINIQLWCILVTIVGMKKR